MIQPVKEHEIIFRNWDQTLTVSEDQTIYAAALAAGIQLPIACNYGGCITCAAKMISGKVIQPGATALNRRQAKAGYILTCVAYPRSNCVLDVGVESHDQLYQNPFAAKA
ncbi:MAG: 2Fe-2S iron-sulfur cluster-binding protein [Anaerolineae bacterium]